MVKVKNLFLGLAFLFGFGKAFSQGATVFGTAPEYKGVEIIFYAYSDYITETEYEIGRCKVDKEGHFSAKLKVLETDFVFSHLGVYRIYFFAEPGKSYELVLPPREDKTEEQRLNPYFRESDLQVGIKNIGKDDINFLINAFDLRFNQDFDQIVQDAYRGRQHNIDSLISKIESKFSNSGNPFFEAYREYRYGLLKQITFIKKSTATSNELFLNRPILYRNPAYMELFNLVYDKYFLFFSRTSRGNAIFDDISRYKSLTRLRKTLATDEVLSNDTLMEMVILKSLHDEFFSDNFSRSALLTILDSLYRSTKIPEHVVIAENIRNRITKLLPGFVPAPFTLKDVKGRDVSLDKFKGKYVYLNFCTTTSYTCLKEFVQLEKICKQYKKHLEVVTISADKDINDLKVFLDNTNYHWTFLHFGNKPEVLRDFDIRVYPTYFLIGPDRKMIMSPAPSPEEGFERRFFQLLRSRGEL
ncbi:TlpA family protein disulfide reductase [Tenuifilum thalassicum]|uniref:TlpA family protein disulfide reductase n=1 Tax=Tenuifilum thalassicum TaxID=2590900 RepID=A0A7D4C7S8_9BACT|nr:TlpA disulfide reductase family protein [Tenuifilum thalassicum]QKG79202.1 TlpA family protein disulfide reductase [Tenuifilum thalassicum]